MTSPISKSKSKVSMMDFQVSRSGLSDSRYSSPLKTPILVDTVDVTYIDKFLGDKEIGRLMEEIKQSSTAKRITLRGNCIGPTGAYLIASVLKTNNQISLLSLEWNQILSEGAIKLAEALETNKALIHLDLRNNNISDDGAIALAKSLQINTILRSLDLRWNQITDKGALAFRECLLNRHPSLKLSITGNLINDHAMTSIEIWSSTGYDHINESEVELPEDRTQNTDITTKAQNDILHKELQDLRSKFSSHQSNMSDLKRQLDVSAVRITELEQNVIREEFTVKSLDEMLKQSKETITILQDEKRNMMASWDLERNHILGEMKNMMLEKDSEIMKLKGEKDASQDRQMKAEAHIDRLTTQLKELNEAMAHQRQVTLDELKITLNKCNDLSINDSKLKSENASLKHNLDRATERIIVLEHQLQAMEESNLMKLSVEMTKHQEEIVKIRDSYSLHNQKLSETHSIQYNEIISLQSQLAQLNLETSKRITELQQSHDENIDTIRTTEKKRYLEQEVDLKRRLEIMTNSYRDSENRSNELFRELETVTKNNKELNGLIESRSKALESELKLKRQEVLDTKDKVLKLEGELMKKSIDNDELHHRYEDMSKEMNAYKKENQNLLILKEFQSKRISDLEHQLKELQESKSQEFQLMSTHMQQILQNEFQVLRGRFHIDTHPSYHTTEAGTSSATLISSLSIAESGETRERTRESNSGSPSRHSKHRHRSSSGSKHKQESKESDDIQ